MGICISGRPGKFPFVAICINTLNLDLDALDFEVTLRERLRNWDLLVSGGIRYGRNAFSFGPPTIYFEGTGPTVSLEGARCVGSRGLYVVGNFRTSLLIGEIQDPGMFTVGAPSIDDEITTVLESQLGVGWAREMGRAEMHLRAVWETQFWMNDTIADPNISVIGSHLGLGGFTVAAEVRL